MTSSRRPELTHLAWRKASASHPANACVELARFRDMVAMRDSKDPEGPALLYTKAELRAFLDGAKRGEFDDLC